MFIFPKGFWLVTGHRQWEFGVWDLGDGGGERLYGLLLIITLLYYYYYEYIIWFKKLNTFYS